MRRTLITRPRKDAADFARLLRAAGFEPVLFPTIDLRPVADNAALQHAIEKQNCYEWVVFTSAHAVQFFPIAQFSSLQDGHKEKVRIAAIGTKTAEALRAYGIEPDLLPDTHTAEALVAAMGNLQGCWVLFPCSDIAREALPEGVANAGGVVHQIVTYHTLPAAPSPEGLEALRAGVDWLTFTSPSTIRNFMILVRQAGLDPLNLPGQPRTACIGPVTADAARELGFRVDAVAEPHTVEGLMAAIQMTDNGRQSVDDSPSQTNAT